MTARGLRLNVLDLLHSPGARRSLHDSVAWTAPLEVSASRVPVGADVAFDLTAEAHGKQVVVVGTVTAPWVGECRRCLEPAAGTLQVSLREVFDRDPVDGETWPIQGDSIDLAPVLAQALVLDLPIAPLCGPDCLGPDPERFPAQVETDLQDEEPPRDPRWAGLDALRFDAED